MMKINRNYYVYKFLNKDGVVIYVGRTVNLEQRFRNHEHLTDKVTSIQYITCSSEAEMVIKEIYYINLYYNELSENVSDVYNKNKERIKDLHLQDKWRKYKYLNGPNGKEEFTNLKEKYEKYVLNSPKHDYENLIHVINHRKLNTIGNDPYAISQQWFAKHDSDEEVDRLRKHMINFYRHILPIKNKRNVSKQFLWTTYNCAVDKIKDGGYTKGFINLYQDYDGTLNGKKYLAFIANPYLPAKRKSTNFEIDSDQFALMELLKFMLQSDLKLGKEIWIYIPSSRMRELLRGWVETKTQKNGI